MIILTSKINEAFLDLKQIIGQSLREFQIVKNRTSEKKYTSQNQKKAVQLKM